jgi:uncharacterized protein (TIGR02246 family)
MNRPNYGRNLHAIVMALFACALTASAQGGAATPDARAADEAAIRENVRRMETGWNTKSGARFAEPFAEDADYVVINGVHLHGRAAIAESHQHIFDTIYKETSISLSVKQLRFLRPDVAVVHAGGLRAGKGWPAGGPGGILTLIMVRDAGTWKIAALQNTQVAQ